MAIVRIAPYFSIYACGAILQRKCLLSASGGRRRRSKKLPDPFFRLAFRAHRADLEKIRSEYQVKVCHISLILCVKPSDTGNGLHFI